MTVLREMTLLRWLLPALFASAPALFGQALKPADLLKQPMDAWPTYNGDYSGRRFSPLAQIDSSNVHNLSLAWAARFTAGAGGGCGRGGAGGGGVQSTPLMVDGILYFTSPNHVWAADARMARMFHELDPVTPVTIGAAFSDNMVEMGDAQDVLSFHNYLPTRAAIRADIAKAKAYAAKVNKPLINTEIGCLARANPYDVTLEEHMKASVGWYIWELMTRACPRPSRDVRHMAGAMPRHENPANRRPRRSMARSPRATRPLFCFRVRATCA